MLDKNEVVEKMKERGFTVYAYIGSTKIQFISSHIYDTEYIFNTPKRKRVPVINILIDLEKDEFQCRYNASRGLNYLLSPKCGSVLNDKHFDRIVGDFESDAKLLTFSK